MEVEVLIADIPLLLSVKEMVNLGVTIDTVEEGIRVKGEKTRWIRTETGQMAIRIHPRREVEDREKHIKNRRRN